MAVTGARGGLSIGQLAKQAACNLETIRYYERIGLLRKPPRTAGGHRLYGGEAAGRLSFIRRARELGFAIDDIRGLLGLVDGRAVTCAGVRRITDRQLATVKSKVADLRKLERVLAAMTASCAGGDVPECPIIDALFSSKTAR